MPRPMTPEDVLRELRTNRFAPKAGRPWTFAWLARQSGYDQVSLYRAIKRGYVAIPMANALRQSLTLLRSDNALSLGRHGAGLDGRGLHGRGGKRLRQAPATGTRGAPGDRSIEKDEEGQ